MRMLIFFLLLLLAPASLHASQEAGKTRFFDISIEPQKKVFSPGELMEVKITVKDKTSGEPVVSALVTADVTIYQGGYTQEREVEEAGRQVLVMEQVITRKVKGIKAEEQGGGVYILSQELETQALWGGAAIRVNVTKGEKSDSATGVASFMGFSVIWYAAAVTLFALIAGSSVGVLFGHVARQ